MMSIFRLLIFLEVVLPIMPNGIYIFEKQSDILKFPKIKPFENFLLYITLYHLQNLLIEQTITMMEGKSHTVTTAIISSTSFTQHKLPNYCYYCKSIKVTIKVCLVNHDTSLTDIQLVCMQLPWKLQNTQIFVYFHAR